MENSRIFLSIMIKLLN